MVVIIGGGGAGLYYACLTKEKNHETRVIVVEEHLDIGKPVQCTGILTTDIKKFVPLKELGGFTENIITKTKVYSPNKSIEIKISPDTIINNVGLIKYLHERALKSGVEIMEGYRYTGNEGIKIFLRNIKTKQEITLEDNYLVGADGPSSLVAKNNGLYGKRAFLTGVQARVEVEKKFDRATIEFYPHLGEYAWFTPESEKIARIGVAAKRNAKKIFDEFIKKYPGKVLDWQGGPIPFHKPGYKVYRKTGLFRVALIGDAAMQVKNTTGGGIIPGMKAAEALAKGFDEYEKNVKPLHKELYIHYLLNKALSKYSDKDWDLLVKRVNSKNVKEILANNNRDNAKKMVLRLARSKGMVLEGIKAARKIILRV